MRRTLASHTAHTERRRWPWSMGQAPCAHVLGLRPHDRTETLARPENVMWPARQLGMGKPCER